MEREEGMIEALMKCNTSILKYPLDIQRLSTNPCRDARPGMKSALDTVLYFLLTFVEFLLLLLSRCRYDDDGQ